MAVPIEEIEPGQRYRISSGFDNYEVVVLAVYDGEVLIFDESEPEGEQFHWVTPNWLCKDPPPHFP